MNFIRKNWQGIFLCLSIAVPAWLFGKYFPVIGAPIIAIILGMIAALLIENRSRFDSGIRFVSKKILQYAVVLLGFGLNIFVVLDTGRQSFPIIIATISTSLVIAFVLQKTMAIPLNTATLIGVGSSICGGSAIAATAPVIEADDGEVAQAISVIFFFNVLAAIFFPALGTWLGFSTTNGNAFGIFAGTAINDTSSVTAAASTWDSLYGLGSATLDQAVTVKLTRTLAIIPIALALGLYHAKAESHADSQKVSVTKIFPTFILFFILASVITTIATAQGVPSFVFAPIKEISKFFIVLAMAAIGLNTDLLKLLKTGGKPLVMGFACWAGITAVSLLMQHFLGIW